MAVLVLALIVALLGFANAVTISVPSGSDLQTFISAANCGDTLVLEAGATYTGTFVLAAPGAACTGNFEI
jgi:nitrous oxidase accessory protein NosD